MAEPRLRPEWSKSCPTHCCQIHGCKYCYDDCPVATGQIKGMTGCCEDCGLAESGYYGEEGIYIQELEEENLRLKEEIAELKRKINGPP